MAASIRRRLAVLLATVSGAAALVLTGAAPTQAHAYLEGSNPGDGATLSTSPPMLELRFTEHVLLNATTVVLTDGDGRHVPVRHLRLLTEDTEDTETPAQVVASIPALRPDTYRVAWRTLSSDDLHETSGVLVFGIRTRVQAAAPEESRPSALGSAGSALLFVGTALALGGLLARWVLLPTGGYGARAARRRLAGAAAAGAGLAMPGSVMLPLQRIASHPSEAAGILGSSYPVRLGLLEGGLVLVGLAALGSRREGSRRTLGVVTAMGAGATGVGAALLGHAAGGRSTDWWRVAATAAHLVAALTWAGALGCLAVTLGASSLGRGEALPVRAALRRFGPPAAACVAVAAATGFFLASEVVVSLDAAVTTWYGRTLLIKLVLAGVVGSLALVNHRRVRDRRRPAVPRRTIMAEAAAGLLVVLVTAVLSNGQPAVEPGLVDTVGAATVGPVNRQVGDVQESLDIRPNRPGPAVVTVDAFDTRRPTPGPIAWVSVQVAGGPAVAATSLGDGHWSAPVKLLPSGATGVRVVVARAASTPESTSYTWTVASALHTDAPVLSRSPLRPWLLAISALLAFAAAAGGLSVVLKRRSHVRARSAVPNPRQGTASPQTGATGMAASRRAHADA